MVYGSFIPMAFKLKVSAFIVIFVELAFGRLYAIDRNLNINEMKYLPPVVQHLEVPEVPPEYEDDDKPSKYLVKIYKLNKSMYLGISIKVKR